MSGARHIEATVTVPLSEVYALGRPASAHPSVVAMRAARAQLREGETPTGLRLLAVVHGDEVELTARIDATTGGGR